MMEADPGRRWSRRGQVDPRGRWGDGRERQARWFGRVADRRGTRTVAEGVTRVKWPDARAPRFDAEF